MRFLKRKECRDEKYIGKLPRQNKRTKVEGINITSKEFEILKTTAYCFEALYHAKNPYPNT